jgi:uncharacterized membrane protein YhaH (DUF805 family)|tara:strand:+ start:246 stop:578 length:333 start_codon:yes stop_codon:yes gene_type:complete
MNLSQSILTCSSKYGDFEGRASRSEFWWFYLFVVAFNGAANSLGISFLAYFILTIPICAVGTRRFHDINKSGWYLLLALTIIGIIPLIILLCKKGSQEKNKYGEPINLYT